MSISFFSYSQYNRAGETFGKNFRIFVGTNTVNNAGTRSPVKATDEWAFSNPISFGVESAINRNFSFEQSFSFNKFKESSSEMLDEDILYFSTSANIRYYLNDLIKSDKFEVFVNGGIGIFNMDETNTSANLGGGIQYWISENIAVRVRSIGKFAFKAKHKQFDNNHYQHCLEVVFKL